MPKTNEAALTAIDISGPVEIAPRIWWVGHHLPEDSFQCHVYLIEHGDQSVLIDPGSNLTFRHSFAKIERVLPFSSIRYFICQHQDPDITACLPVVDSIVSRPDACVVSQWRANALIKHYGLRLPLWCVEKDGGWRLDLGGRMLRFVFTPYLHFPGAFCTFDEESGTLFSSDIFGGFTDEHWELYAKDESYLKSIQPFHEHYMPSREILFSGLSRLEELPLRRIAPQHGSIIPEHLVKVMFRLTKELDCGIYLMAHSSTDVQKLSRLNSLLQTFLRNLNYKRSFKGIAGELLLQIKTVLPVAELSFFAINDRGLVLSFAAETRYRGVPAAMPRRYEKLLGEKDEAWRAVGGQVARLKDDRGRDILVLALADPASRRVYAAAELLLEGPLPEDEETLTTIAHLGLPLAVALEREIMYRSMDLERERFYQQSIRDPLTGLYTRYFMHETVKRFLALHDRGVTAFLEILVCDLDHFKRINDNYGHLAGDEVLKAVAQVIEKEGRQGDIRIRFGGEEFAVFIVSSREGEGTEVAERIRAKVESLRLSPPLDETAITISIGVARRHREEALADALRRADIALYQAKEAGRNRVAVHPG